MKRVSLKVAKYLTNIDYITNNECRVYIEQDPFKSYIAPTYLEVWLWLWQEKGIQIDIDYTTRTCSIFRYALCCKSFELSNPEEAIITAIEYLVDNDLIK